MPLRIDILTLLGTRVRCFVMRMTHKSKCQYNWRRTLWNCIQYTFVNVANTYHRLKPSASDPEFHICRSGQRNARIFRARHKCEKRTKAPNKCIWLITTWTFFSRKANRIRPWRHSEPAEHQQSPIRVKPANNE